MCRKKRKKKQKKAQKTTTFISYSNTNKHTQTQIELKDDRILQGILQCFDSEGNIILRQACWINAGFKKNEKRNLGTALVTKEWRKKVFFKEPNPIINEDTNNTDNNNVISSQNVNVPS